MTRRPLDEALREERRRQVLDAAVECFRREGFRGASMADICQAARMSPGHLYHYFTGKEAIIEAIAEDDLARRLAEVERAAAAPDVLDALITFGVETRDHATSGGLGGALRAEIAAEASHNPRIAAILARFHGRLEARLGEVLATAQRQGQVDPALDPALLAVVMGLMADGFHARLASEPGLAERERMLAMAAVLRRMLSGR
ncbi:TetR/AcrR family transcriptional regulator [Roseococcus microcysteis]|uniref:TetR/AcrR family transcriptional regulator n=1 Tax=Roseococcus microcysteis TaxID=2771361 RepID=UPI00168B6209|nr:TetR/AcrR family transcriptional regulator [Roseococcus microcysteis]